MTSITIFVVGAMITYCLVRIAVILEDINEKL